MLLGGHKKILRFKMTLARHDSSTHLPRFSRVFADLVTDVGAVLKSINQSIKLLTNVIWGDFFLFFLPCWKFDCSPIRCRVGLIRSRESWAPLRPNHRKCERPRSWGICKAHPPWEKFKKVRKYSNKQLANTKFSIKRSASIKFVISDQNDQIPPKFNSFRSKIAHFLFVWNFSHLFLGMLNQYSGRSLFFPYDMTVVGSGVVFPICRPILSRKYIGGSWQARAGLGISSKSCHGKGFIKYLFECRETSSKNIQIMRRTVVESLSNKSQFHERRLMQKKTSKAVVQFVCFSCHRADKLLPIEKRVQSPYLCVSVPRPLFNFLLPLKARKRSWRKW